MENLHPWQAFNSKMACNEDIQKDVNPFLVSELQNKFNKINVEPDVSDAS